MARGDQTAQTGEKQALANAGTLNNNAQSIYSSLAPTLAGDVAHPQGFNPTEIANMNTAAQESAGGSQAATVGQGGLLAARTRNAGAPMAAIAQGARTAGQGLSKAALDIANRNAMLKQSQRSEAIGGQERLYGAGVTGGVGSLNAGAGLSNANTNASNASWNWAKYILDPAMAAAGQGAGMAAMG